MKYITYQETGAVGQITINRPAELNALNAAVLEELEQTLAGISLAAVRCLIITGAGGKAFVSGADVGEMADFTKEQAEAFSRFGNRVFRKIELLPIPVIAAVNGYAFGGGCELALCCDIRVCTPGAVFGQPETKLGIMPGFGGTQRLARLIGLGRAKELIYGGLNLSAEDAERFGLVNHIYEKETFEEQYRKLADQIAGQAPIAVRHAKAAIQNGIDLELKQGLLLEAELFGQGFETRDQQVGMQSFLQKKPMPVFENK